MSSEGISVTLTPYTKAVWWEFRPIYNGTPNKIEWILEYTMGWHVGVTASEDWGRDMGRLKYQIYNNNTTTWENFSDVGHFFHGNEAGDDTCYIGCWTKQAFYGEKTTNPSYYINDDGIVKVKMSFNVNEYATYLDMECQTDVGTTTYLNRDAELVTYYNGVMVT